MSSTRWRPCSYLRSLQHSRHNLADSSLAIFKNMVNSYQSHTQARRCSVKAFRRRRPQGVSGWVWWTHQLWHNKVQQWSEQPGVWDMRSWGWQGPPPGWLQRRDQRRPNSSSSRSRKTSRKGEQGKMGGDGWRAIRDEPSSTHNQKKRKHSNFRPCLHFQLDEYIEYLQMEDVFQTFLTWGIMYN